jgi:low affinity Fe/Cu permease
MANTKLSTIDRISTAVTWWVGTPVSIMIHTFFFIGIFALYLFGFKFDQILLILTTAVSLEAIYLSLLIQMTVNKNTASLADVEEDIDDIQEDVEDLGEDVDKIQDDVEDLGEDVEDLGEDVDKIQEGSEKNDMPEKTLKHLQTLLIEISKDIDGLEKDIQNLKTKS